MTGVGIGLAVRQNQRHQAEKTQQQPLPRRIAALGRVEPLDRVVELSVSASLSNDAVRELRVKEGQQMSKGQVLAVMDSAQSLDRSVRKAQAAVQVAERKVTAQVSVISRYRAELTQATVGLRCYTSSTPRGTAAPWCATGE